MTKIYASLISVGDASQLYSGLDSVIAAGVDGVHLDVMESVATKDMLHFSSAEARKMVHYLNMKDVKPDFVVDAHLLMQRPHDTLDSYKDAGVSRITIHYAAFRDSRTRLLECIAAARENTTAVKAGISFYPGDVVDVLDLKVLRNVDYLIVMGAVPGAEERQALSGGDIVIRQIAAMRESFKFGLEILAEGGITAENAKTMRKAGADGLVLGKALFDSDDHTSFIRRIKHL
jgi:ribulose-phosphate 3-epimerase